MIFIYFTNDMAEKKLKKLTEKVSSWGIPNPSVINFSQRRDIHRHIRLKMIMEVIFTDNEVRIPKER